MRRDIDRVLPPAARASKRSSKRVVAATYPVGLALDEELALVISGVGDAAKTDD
ncbi:MAG: hypothetical protein WAS54_02160 [Scrofimicrobium sp.]